MIKLPDSVPPMVRRNFEVMLPGIVLSFVFFIIAYIFSNTSFKSLYQAIYTLIQTPLKGIGGNIWSIIFIATLGQVLWFFGLHGTNLTVPII